jgi:phosphoserine aminotransferase
MSKIHNFSAGPAILPQEVIQQSSEAILNFNNSGLSLLEVSHRGKDFVAVMEEARSLVKELLGLNDDYSVLYLGGGASLQFAMVAHNFLSNNGKAAYINTGVWSTKAIEEAQRVGKVDVIASSKDKNFNYIPKGFDIASGYDYVHLTSNNTIYGTQFHDFPTTNNPLIGDMSSDIFSKAFDANKFSLIYAGAQKNIGPAGTTMVVFRNDFLNKVERNKFAMMDYSVHLKNDSMFNTPPVFPIYVTMLTLRWLKNNGGVAWIEKLNREKSALLYNEIDRNSLFEGTAAKEDRSLMNTTFVLKDSSLDDAFTKLCKENNISGLAGHRSVGGFRASTYNAMSKESIQVLVDLMKHFEDKNA